MSNRRSREDDSIHNVFIPPQLLPLQRTQLQTLDYDARKADWSQAMRGRMLVNPVNLTKWLVICTNRDLTDTNKLLGELKFVAGPMGFEFSPPRQ